MLGFGTGTAFYKTGDESKLDQACIDSVCSAVKLGYYHLDGAEVYKTETELGTAIKESGVSRDKLFVTTKVITNVVDIHSAIDTSLKKLQLEYVDLYVLTQVDTLRSLLIYPCKLPHSRSVLRGWRQGRSETARSLESNGRCTSFWQGKVNWSLKLPATTLGRHHEDCKGHTCHESD